MALIEQPFEEEKFDSLVDDVSNIAEQTPEPAKDNSSDSVEAEASSVTADEVPDKYKGKSLEEIIKMHREAEKMIGRQAQEVHEVRTLADQLIKRQLEDKPHQIVENAPEVDFFENPQAAMQREIERNPVLQEARQAANELKKMKTAQQLSTKHPDFGTIVQDPGFQDWVKASTVRLGLYAKADGEFDFEAADELLSTYKQLKQVRSSSAQEAGKQQKAQALKAAAVDTSGSGEVAKKVYRRADLIRLKMSDPDRYNQLQPEIMAAYSEGRVK